MAVDSSPEACACIKDELGILKTIIMLCALPFHVFLMKILVKDLQLAFSRHRILLSLSLGDSTLVLGLLISTVINESTTLKIGSSGCTIHRAFAIFIACSTLVVSSASIIALAVERYIACIHSFHLHRILTDSRIRHASICTWILAAIIGLLAAFTNHYDNELLIPNYSVIQCIYLLFTIPTSIAVIFIQIRLFTLSRTKINRVIPIGVLGFGMEPMSYKKKQIKIALIAGIVAIAFVVCLVPLAVVFIRELLCGVPVSPFYRSVFLCMSFSNSVADPFIYGLGITDTRHKIIRDLKKFKQFSLEMLPEISSRVSNI